ncbi:hypothetical protein JR316_0009494 [Psilocybe cubensis]|uniref:Uncharacterized protein n=1 Tax=Psilocybe cubensis TaxID=181762 RepID=A0ACB8GQL0_PSICU|nr:hypothetical protein JR316_0009494 [Psilocybe cubensis]KAH9477290.1 hypothetical protein JR316_0009494 [Psilocybe cubensis]
MYIPTRPTLPIELLDDIVSTAWGVVDAQSISRIALTSHVFHSLVNKCRFGHLILHRTGASHDVEHTGRKMTRLADLVRSGRAHERLPNLCSFVTTFEVELIGFRDLIMPTLEDGNFAYILDNLFRANDPPDDYVQSSSIYSLSLYVYRKRRQPADSDLPRYDDSEGDAYEGLAWESLDPVLKRALENILRFSRLNRLCLNVMRRLPRDFLRHSGIKHLFLRRCSISYSPLRPYNDSDYSGDGDCILQLESLDIDGSVSCVDIEQIVACHVTTLSVKSPMSILPVLTKLAMDITCHEEFRDFNEILEQAPSLRELSVGLKMTQGILFA